MNCSTVNCSIAQQNIVMYHKQQYFTTNCDILPQIERGNSIGYTTTNVVFHYKV